MDIRIAATAARWLAAAAIALALAACHKVETMKLAPGLDTGSDADSDSDSDADSDSDSDTDADSGTDTGSEVDDPNADDDDDGYSPFEGDCDDEDEDVNPDAIEVVEDGVSVDDDCDGETDEVDPPCDDGIALDDVDPMNGARAMELCKTASVDGTDWGVISAAYVRANGVAAALPTPQIGVQTYFGTSVAPLQGASMLALSSGAARTPGQPEACGTQACLGCGPGAPPPDFPQDTPDCPGDNDIYDDVGLELRLRAPSNAVGYRIEYRFYSFEFPEYVCTSFNDQFIALVGPPPDGSINGNVAFDEEGNPVSVNICYFTTCAYDPEVPDYDCPDGPGELAGTGFDGIWGDGGATQWLETTVPVEGGADFTIRFAIWDTGDQVLDSTVLIDGFEWIATGDAPAVETVPVD